jgi:hypothetical protein
LDDSIGAFYGADIGQRQVAVVFHHNRVSAGIGCGSGGNRVGGFVFIRNGVDALVPLIDQSVVAGGGDA